MKLLKELLASGVWKSEISFRSGLLAKLEEKLRAKLLGTDLRSNPHIRSMIMLWKRHHAAIQTTLADSGGGFNTETKVLDVSDIAWEKAVKREPTVTLMRYKVFGNDGATGGSSQTIIDVVNDLVSEDGHAEATASNPSAGTTSPDENGPCEMDVESQTPTADP